MLSHCIIDIILSKFDLNECLYSISRWFEWHKEKNNESHVIISQSFDDVRNPVGWDNISRKFKVSHCLHDPTTDFSCKTRRVCFFLTSHLILFENFTKALSRFIWNSSVSINNFFKCLNRWKVELGWLTEDERISLTGADLNASIRYFILKRFSPQSESFSKVHVFKQMRSIEIFTNDLPAREHKCHKVYSIVHKRFVLKR